MAKPSKCKYCDEIINKEDMIIKIEYTAKGKEKKIRLHSKCELEYDELMEYKNHEVKWFKELFEHVKGVLGYSDGQIMPSYLITRLQDLRNGTMLERGTGRTSRSKEGYQYEVILDTFLTHSDKIEWCFKNKTFKTEKNKINYMMAIIENNINDNYIYFREKNLSDIVKG